MGKGLLEKPRTESPRFREEENNQDVNRCKELWKRRGEEKSILLLLFLRNFFEGRPRLQNHLTIPLRFEIKRIETKIFQHRYDTK